MLGHGGKQEDMGNQEDSRTNPKKGSEEVKHCILKETKAIRTSQNGFVKTRSSSLCLSTLTDTMEYSSQYYLARIAETKARSESRAQELLGKADRGEMSYTEAWHSLPGPVPIVEVQTHGGMGPRPQLSYIIQYPFLSKEDAVRVKTHAEREWQEAMDARESNQRGIPYNHEQRKDALTKAVESTRKAFDGHLIGFVSRKSQLEELRANLAACEKAYVIQQREFEEAKQAKEHAELAHLDYTSKADAIVRVAMEETESVLNRFGKYRDDNVERQRREHDEWMTLWNTTGWTDFDERGRAAEARIELTRAQERETRIENEIQRRSKDLEFEAAVTARLRARQG